MAEPEPPGDGSGGEPSDPDAGPAGFAEMRFMQALAGWAAGQRVAGAAAGRSRLRALSEAAAGSATLVGLLVDLAERGAEVAITCTAPAPNQGAGATTVTGTVVGVGRDFVVMEQHSRRPVIIRTSSLASVQPLGGGAEPDAPGGDRPAPLALSLEAVLAELAAELAPIALGTGSGRLDGDLLAVGQDVLTLRSGVSPRRVIHIPTASLQWCELR